jgi:hypothetical protein
MSSVKLNGHLNYDGGDKCQTGFQYRKKPSEEWINGWNPTSGGYWYSDQPFACILSNLTPRDEYEYRAMAKNVMGTGYGSVMEFTVPYGAVPTSTGGGIDIEDLIPEQYKNIFAGLSSGVKLLLAIIINIGGVVVVAAKLGRSKGVGIAAGVTGLGLLILFIIIGWYPSWVLILCGAVVGLLVLFFIMGRR